MEKTTPVKAVLLKIKQQYIVHLLYQNYAMLNFSAFISTLLKANIVERLEASPPLSATLIELIFCVAVATVVDDDDLKFVDIQSIKIKGYNNSL